MMTMNKYEILKRLNEIKDTVSESISSKVKDISEKAASLKENTAGKTSGTGMPENGVGQPAGQNTVPNHSSMKTAHTGVDSLNRILSQIKKAASLRNNETNAGAAETAVDEEKQERDHYIKQWVIFLIVMLIMFIVIRANFRLEKSLSGSMEPTIMVGDYGFTYKRAYKNSSPKNGDMIVFRLGRKIVGKRVMGTPGDTIAFKDGYVYRNGKKVVEKYLDDDVETNSLRTFKVPANSVFVLGDNREVSYDSRYWEQPYVPYSDIVGKILFVIPAHYFDKK